MLVITESQSRAPFTNVKTTQVVEAASIPKRENSPETQMAVSLIREEGREATQHSIPSNLSPNSRNEESSALGITIGTPVRAFPIKKHSHPVMAKSMNMI